MLQVSEYNQIYQKLHKIKANISSKVLTNQQLFARVIK